MFKGNFLFVGLIAFSLVFVTPPKEKKAEGFIFRALGAAVAGVAIGVAAAARFTARVAVGAAIGVARVATFPFRAAGFLLFGRPWWGGWRAGYRYWRPYYQPQYNNYYTAGCYVGYCGTPYYYPTATVNGGTHGMTTVGTTVNTNTNVNRPVEQVTNRQDWCYSQIPASCDTAVSPTTCTLKWTTAGGEAKEYIATNNNACLATAQVRRKACIAGSDPTAVLAINPTCTAGGN